MLKSAKPSFALTISLTCKASWQARCFAQPLSQSTRRAQQLLIASHVLQWSTATCLRGYILFANRVAHHWKCPGVATRKSPSSPLHFMLVRLECKRVPVLTKSFIGLRRGYLAKQPPYREWEAKCPVLVLHAGPSSLTFQSLSHSLQRHSHGISTNMAPSVLQTAAKKLSETETRMI